MGRTVYVFHSAVSPQSIAEVLSRSIDEEHWTLFSMSGYRGNRLIIGRVGDKVREIVTDGAGLDRWREQGERLLERRKKVLNQFLSKLEVPNSKPRKARKAIKRKPIFQPGDCLAVRLQDGDWGAILVLMGEPESDDPYKETHGTNLIVTLRYKSPEMPSLAVFEKREHLYLTHHSWKNQLELSYVTARGFRKIKDCFVRIGTIGLRRTDPQTAKMYSSWSNV